MPMIRITTSSSISVKPLSPVRLRRLKVFESLPKKQARRATRPASVASRLKAAPGYQVPPLHEAPPPPLPVEQEREIVPFDAFVIVKVLPDFEKAATV